MADVTSRLTRQGRNAGYDIEGAAQFPQPTAEQMLQVGLLAAPAGPFARLISAAPRTVGATIGGLLGMSSANEVEAQAKKSKANPDEKLPNGYTMNDLQRIAESAGIGVNDLSVMKRSQVQAVASRAAEIKMTSGSVVDSAKAQAEAEKILQEAMAEAARKDAATPWRERQENKDFAGKLPYYGMAAAAGLPFALKSVSNVGSFMPMSTPSRVARATHSGEAALATGNTTQAALREAELTALLKNRSGKIGEIGKAGGAALAGGGLAAEAQLFPDQFDAFNPSLPEGPVKDAARERALSVMPYIERGVIGALTGLSGYKAAGLVPSRTPDWTRAEATRDVLRAQKSTDGVGAAPSPAAPGGAGVGNAPSSLSQSQLPPPAGPAAGSPFQSYDPATHGAVSRQYLDELLTSGSPARAQSLAQSDTASNVVQQLQGRYASGGLPPVDPSGLQARAQGSLDAASDLAQILQGTNSQITNPRLRDMILNAIHGKDHTLALPLGALPPALAAYYGGGSAEPAGLFAPAQDEFRQFSP